ncbi:hypothetical protein GCM10027456_81650 [Kineosporia babensis]
MGHEALREMDLQDLIFGAVERGFWSQPELDTWRGCLSVRTRILQGESVELVDKLALRVLWLRGLTMRTAVLAGDGSLAPEQRP